MVPVNHIMAGMQRAVMGICYSAGQQPLPITNAHLPYSSHVLVTLQKLLLLKIKPKSSICGPGPQKYLL